MLLHFPLLGSIRLFVISGFPLKFSIFMISSRGIKNPRVSWGAKVPAKVHVTVRVKARVPATKSFLVYQGDDCGKKRTHRATSSRRACLRGQRINSSNKARVKRSRRDRENFF